MNPLHASQDFMDDPNLISLVANLSENFIVRGADTQHDELSDTPPLVAPPRLSGRKRVVRREDFGQVAKGSKSARCLSLGMHVNLTFESVGISHLLC